MQNIEYAIAIPDKLQEVKIRFPALRLTCLLLAGQFIQVIFIARPMMIETAKEKEYLYDVKDALYLHQN